MDFEQSVARSIGKLFLLSRLFIKSIHRIFPRGHRYLTIKAVHTGDLCFDVHGYQSLSATIFSHEPKVPAEAQPQMGGTPSLRNWFSLVDTAIMLCFNMVLCGLKRLLERNSFLLEDELVSSD